MLSSIAEESARYGADPRFREVSRFNPSAVRGPNGIWNEETLPVLEWEAAEYRVVLPAWLQEALGISVPVLRWSRAKRALVLTRHGDVGLRLVRLTELLNGVEWAGREPREAASWRIMFRDERRWFQAIIGEDKLGRTNMVTVYQLRPNQASANMNSGWMVRWGEK